MSNRTFLGKVGMTPRGEWNNSTTYERLDVVTYEGSSYIALTQSRNSRPSEENQDWMVAAKHGEFTEEQLEEFKEAVITESKQEIEEFTEIQKDELDDYERIKESELDDYTTGKKGDIDTHTTQKIEAYNANANEKQSNFNTNATNKTNTFNENATSKTTDYNDNASSKTTAFDNNAVSKTNAFNSNVTEKTTTFNENATTKTTDFNTNATNKKSDFNSNATSKTNTFNTNASDKLEAYNTNDAEKTEAFNQNAQEKTEAFDEHTVELEIENERLRNDINAGTLTVPGTGENVTLENTTEARFKKFGAGGNREQDSTEGSQLFDFNTTPYLSHSTAVFSNDVLTITTESGHSFPGASFSNADFLSILRNHAGEQMWLKWDGIQISGTSNAAIRLEGTGLSGMTFYSQVTGQNNPVVIPDTIPDNVVLRIITYNGATSPDCSITITKPILYVGTETKPAYEPYTGGQPAPNPDYECPIHSVGENGTANVVVCNKNLWGGFSLINTSADITYNHNADGTITADGTATATSYSMTSQRGKDYLKPLLAGTYTISGGGSDYTIQVCDSVGNTLATTTTTVFTDTFTIAEDTQVFVRVKVNSGTTLTNKKIYLQLEKNSTTTDYVPHQEQDFTIPCQKEMVDQSDYFDCDNEEEVHGWNKVVFNGTENWEYTNNVFRILKSDVITTDNTKAINIKSNYYINYPQSTIQSAEVDYGISARTGNGSTNGIAIRNKDYTDVNNFKEYLAQQYTNGTPVYAWYKLATPEQLQFTEQQKTEAKQIKDTAHSYGEKTHIYSTDDVSPNFDVEAIGDINKIIQSLDSRLTLVE